LYWYYTSYVMFLSFFLLLRLSLYILTIYYCTDVYLSHLNKDYFLKYLYQSYDISVRSMALYENSKLQ